MRPSQVDIELELMYLADNRINSIALNGNLLPVDNHAERTIGTTLISDGSFFNVGANELRFELENFSGSGFNPVGINFQGNVAFATPEPSGALMFFGAIGLLTCIRRRSDHG